MAIFAALCEKEVAMQSGQTCVMGFGGVRDGLCLPPFVRTVGARD